MSADVHGEEARARSGDGSMSAAKMPRGVCLGTCVLHRKPHEQRWECIRWSVAVCPICEGKGWTLGVVVDGRRDPVPCAWPACTVRSTDG